MSPATTSRERLPTDVLVVGSGIAGLTFALKVADHADVLVVTKKDRVDSNTNYAQGGVAAVFSPEDAPELHLADTLVAGAGLCHRRAVEELVREGPDRVRELQEWGARFSRERGGRLALGREAGHSRRRIVHAEDLTGREIERALLAAVAGHPRIRVLENHFAWSLRTRPDPRTFRGRCAGALVLDVHAGRWLEVEARAVLLASGGCGALYRHTTNPEIATGDGIALGYGAGAAVANLEFVQFHPTAMYPTGERAELVSEAVRGEGAVLRARDGTAFMDMSHPDGSLAPRDVVARAIDARLKRSGDAHVLLDLSGIPEPTVRERFPDLARRCRDAGFRIPADPIPVVPAAHYQCGGLLADWDGRSSLAGLWVAGEVACTGVHGANRLASNSLLEALVYAHRAAQRLLAALPSLPRLRGEPEPLPTPTDGEDPAGVSERIRTVMWEHVGIVRSEERLDAAREAIDELERLPLRRPAGGEEAMTARQTEFMRRVARLVVRCAARRRESRGLHWTDSHPHRDSERFLRDTVLAP